MKHVPLDFWATWNAEMKKAAPGVTLLGEQLDGDPSVVATAWAQGGFTSMFDFPLGFAIGDVFCRGDAPAKLGAVLTNDRRYPDPSRLVTLVDNHDLPRLMSICNSELSRVRGALAFLLTARGVPSLAWGTEVGFDGAKEPENRKSMVFRAHPLKDEIAFWLKARKQNPALSEGVPVVLKAGADGLAVMRVTGSQLAIILVGKDGVRPTVPGTALNGPEFRELVPPGSANVGTATPMSVWVVVSRVEPNRYDALFAEAQAQWRTGAKKRTVTFEGPAGSFVVGSGPELGDWAPAKALKLPATVELPVSGAFEFKAIRRDGDRVIWDSGPNGALLVGEPGRDRVVLKPVYPR
ncbi:MAG: hypothetical protein JNJ54_22425 [Myxococcaceae bacterium]|nr:hypothetical protein [Myxococcaceae bacterium]